MAKGLIVTIIGAAAFAHILTPLIGLPATCACMFALGFINGIVWHD